MTSSQQSVPICPSLPHPFPPAAIRGPGRLVTLFLISSSSSSSRSNSNSGEGWLAVDG